MKVLHVDTGRGWRGGQQQVLYLHRGLCRLGVASELVCSARGELLRRAGSEGLPARGLPLWGEWDLVSGMRLGAIARRIGASVIHAHCSHALTLCLLAATRSRSTKVVATRRVDFPPARHPLNRWKYRSPDRLVVISAAIRQIMADFGVRSERLRLVPSGVDLERVSPGSGATVRRELGIGDGEYLIGNVAHLADHKGQRFLVDAVPVVLRNCPRARFLIVGEGELEQDLRAQAAALHLEDRLIFTGFRSDVPAVLDALDLFVMPSHMEGLGTAVMDALAAGKPVVAAAAGGIPEIIEDGHHGLLVPARDPGALAAAILRLAEDPELALRLAAEGLQRVRENFSVDAMVAGNLGVYREVAA